MYIYINNSQFVEVLYLFIITSIWMLVLIVLEFIQQDVLSDYFIVMMLQNRKPQGDE